MASKRRNMFQKNKTQETTENGRSTKYDDPKTPGKKPPSVTPFITGNSKPYFNENPYLAEKVMPVYRKEVEQKYTAYGTFMPNSKMKTMDGCFSARPEYIHEKYIPKNKVDKEFERILKEKAAKFQAISGKKYTTLVNPPFVPNPGIRSTFTGSIVTKNVDMLPFTPGRYRTLEPVTYTDRYLQ
ncbi:hypothetical protein AAG570_009135 [Ranatra chinensis]|uniref:Uncharacterized protein n=1 Tax=Ranatra chinensis TaxID=642074 RepID=A0ABD0YSV3_9HEMI